MTDQSKRFLFVDVSAEKRANTRRVKSYVSNQTNRQKRQKVAVHHHQSLLRALHEAETKEDDTVSHQIIAHSSISSDSYTRSEDEVENQVVTYSNTANYEVACHPRQQLVSGKPEKELEIWTPYQEWLSSHRIADPPMSNKVESLHSNKELVQSSPRLCPSQSVYCLLTSAPTPQWPIEPVRVLDPPGQVARATWTMRAAQDFVENSYQSRWKPVWQEMHWFDQVGNELGAWRECFTLSAEYLNTGKLIEAFSILNAALSSTATFLKADHPALLMGLMNVMTSCQLVQDRRLSSIIQHHLLRLTTVSLGGSHQISLILRELLSAGNSIFYLEELLCTVVLDTIAKCFGKAHFLPVSMQFGTVYRLTQRRDYDGALAAIEKVAAIWAVIYTHNSPLLNVLRFEKVKLERAKEEATEMDVGQSLSSTMEYVEQFRSKFLAFSKSMPGIHIQLQPDDDVVLQNLSRRLLAGGHHAILLFIHTHLQEIFDSTHPEDPLSSDDQEDTNFATSVARIMLRQMRSSAS